MAKMRYFLAYKLQGPDAEAVEKLRQEISWQYDVHQALRIPPHLTLFYPFEMEEVLEMDLQRVLEEFVLTQKPFSLSANGFSHFEDRVWFIDVEQAQSLISLKKNLVRQIYKKMGILEARRGHNGIHFHITLAYKDVTPEKFVQIGEFLARQSVPIVKLEVNSLTLFRFEQDSWVVAKDFLLQAR